MRRLGDLAIRWPKTALVVWLAATIALGLQSLHFEDRLSPSSIDVPGTPSGEAQQLAAKYFGTQTSVPILLEGPESAIEQQGRSLGRRLRDKPGYTVVTPWDPGAGIPELRPRPGAAVLLVAKTTTSFSADTGVAVRQQVDQAIKRPVRASVTGFSTVGADLKDESLRATRDAERVAIPVLLLVLLLVFRSPIAALIPALFGVAAVETGFGAVGLLAQHITISDVATALTSMMGLALGVDYTLLLVSRFREELGAGRSPLEASREAQGSAGRTVVFAGATLIVAMAVAILLSPGEFLVSAAISVATVAALSVISAFFAVPALLCLVGHRIDLWRIGGEPASGGRWARAAEGVQRRPLLFGGAALLPLLALCVPAVGLDTGPPDVRALPDGSRARVEAARVADALGEGWTAPFEVVVADPRGPITTERRLRELDRYQRRLARMPGVDTVLGPGAIVRRQPALLRADRELARTRRSLEGGQRGARELARGLRSAGDGVDELRGGLRRARTAAARLGEGAEQGSDGPSALAQALRDARTGAQKLATGMTSALSGAERLARAAARARRGASDLAAGAGQARTGASKLSSGAGQLAAGLRRGRSTLSKLRSAAGEAERDADRLLLALSTMTVGRADPRYRAALEAAGRLSAFTTGRDPRNGQRVDPDYDGLPRAIDAAGAGLDDAARGADGLRRGARELSSGLRRLAGGARELAGGLGRLQRANGELARGLRRLETGTGDLPAGLGRLEDGADRLADGLTRLDDGSARLAGGLGAGVERTGTLGRGLDRAARRSSDAAGSGRPGERLDRLRNRSPRLLDSGYFVLAALDGSRAGPRTQAGLNVNLEGGGQAAKVTVVPTTGPNAPGTAALRDRLAADLPRLADRLDAEVALGGVAAQVTDYRRVLGDRLPVLILALSVVTVLVLVLVLRCLLLPVISVVLNLLTVGASFGLVALCFEGATPLLGGPGWADILSLLGSFTVVFGLSLDYQVFILTRMREAWDGSGRLDVAITDSIDRTGRVITGAAAIMGAVFVAFTFADLAIVRQAGVALAAAVVIDATLVRMVLLPALMRLAGPAVFWLPRSLDRVLPRIAMD
jgi:putative drug exporter of the RND superfamily